jgi:predicted lysophospholipase L1 biosynthesis ABC-type transport system permease subunit
MHLTSELQSRIDTKTTYIINTNQLVGMVNKTTKIFTIFFFVFILLLILLGFYQLMLLVDQSMKKSMTELSVLRAIGMTDVDTKKLNMIEIQCVMLSSLVIGSTFQSLMNYVQSQEIATIMENPPVLVYFPVSALGLGAINALIVYLCCNYVYSRNIGGL